MSLYVEGTHCIKMQHPWKDDCIYSFNKACRWCLDEKNFRWKELKWKKWGVLWRDAGGDGRAMTGDGNTLRIECGERNGRLKDSK